MSAKWRTYKPGNLQLFVVEDPPQVQSFGGILLTEKLPQAAEVGFHTGVILKAGRDAHKLMGLEHDQDQHVVGLRIVFRKYLSEVFRFREKYEENGDSRNVFIIRADDVTALVGKETRVDGV